jgi:hypothetical protein
MKSTSDDKSRDDAFGMTFNEYIRTPSGKGQFTDTFFYQQLLLATDIRSRKDLLAWCQERYPRYFRQRHPEREDLTGRQLAEEIWAGYLNAKERADIEFFQRAENSPPDSLVAFMDASFKKGRSLR